MYIKVKVITGAKREMVKKISDDCYHISVVEKAENNAANSRVGSILMGAYMFEGKKPRVRIVSGHHSPHKIVSVIVAEPSEVTEE
jgi:uncharacterized protein YggU (UPF0235/DUF167 family)